MLAPRARRSLALLVLVALGSLACSRAPPPPAPPPPSTEERARSLAAALARHDWNAVAEAAAPDGEVLIEIRQVLVETDEREATTLAGRAALRAWLNALEPELDANRAGARWPAGLLDRAGWQPLSSCADALDRSVPRGALTVRRVCFGDARATPSALSYLVLAEAR